MANVIGSDLNNFNPSTDGLGYVTVESGETHKPGYFNLGLFLDYGIQSLPQSNLGGEAPNDHRITTNVHGAVGVSKGWSIGFSMTNLIHDSVAENSLGNALSDSGRESFRLDSKVRFINTNKAKIGALLGVNFNNIENNPYLGDGPGPSIAAGAFYERTTSRTLRWAVNAGYRMRNTGDAIPGFSIEPIENQIFYSLGLNYWYQNWKTYFIGELYGSSATHSPLNETDRSPSNLEILLGAKQKFFKRMEGQVGVTRGLYQGLSTPEFRFYAGLNFYFGPPNGEIYGRGEHGGMVKKFEVKDRDGDGVRDVDDRCPGTPANTMVDRYGCPISIDSAILDDDFDGVDNADDQCPNTRTGVAVDAVGCPRKKGDNSVAYESMDSDADGVLNDYDLCPQTPTGVRVTERGCEVDKIQNVDLGNLNFITGTAKLTPNSRKRFRKKIGYLTKIRNKLNKIVIEGHTDSVGGRQYNQNLSQRRAETIKLILVNELKLPGRKIQARGYGESRPIASNKTKLGRLKNRRVEMNVITH